MKLVPVVVVVAALAGVVGAVAVRGPWGDGARASQSAGIGNFSPSDVPKPAPAVTFRNAAGAAVSLADYKGRVVVVNFWATWCAPCVEELPSLAKAAETLRPEGIEVLALSVDRLEDEKITAFLAANQASPLGLHKDEGMALARALEVKGLPTTVIIGPDGTIRGTLVGPADWASDAALALIRGFKAT